MHVTVELFGVPRARAGVSQLSVVGATLGEVLMEVGRKSTSLETYCLDAGRLRAGYIANINGDRFVSDPETILSEGDSILLMSVDAGG
jgi:molybdopterin converting factor small subunit